MTRQLLMASACFAGILSCSAQAVPPNPTAKAPSGPTAVTATQSQPQTSTALPAELVASPPTRPSPETRLATRRVDTANRAATREPAGPTFLNATQVYAYSPGALYRLYTAPERVTDIALQPGEDVIAVAAGDTVRWTVGDTTSGSGADRQVHVLVKPFAPGLVTNLIITTDRRTYHLHLISTPNSAMAAIAWSYPQDDLIAIRRAKEKEDAARPVAAGISIDQLRFDYRIDGDSPSWRPLRAFDDGRQTFIEFPASIGVGEAPPLFVIGAEGEAQLVNYRQSGRYYVVDRLFEVAELRLGEKRQAIVRISRGAEVRQDRRRRAL